MCCGSRIPADKIVPGCVVVTSWSEMKPRSGHAELVQRATYAGTTLCPIRVARIVSDHVGGGMTLGVGSNVQNPLCKEQTSSCQTQNVMKGSPSGGGWQDSVQRNKPSRSSDIVRGERGDYSTAAGFPQLRDAECRLLKACSVRKGFPLTKNWLLANVCEPRY